MPQFKGETHLSENKIQDIDQAIVNSYEQDLRIQVRGRQVPVVYATQERFAQKQKKKGLRDDNNVLILPLISVRRTGIELIPHYYREQANNADKIVLKQRPATIKNTKTRLKYGNGYSAMKIDKPVVQEYVTTAYPQFYQFRYEITLWSSYVSDMNRMQEQLLEKYRGYYDIVGYRFYGEVEGAMEDISNVNDFTADERIIKSRYNVRLEGFIHDHDEVEIKRSLQTFSFDTEISVDLDD